MRVAELSGVAAGFEPESISPVIQPLYEELCRRLDAAGVTPTGPALAWYEDAPDGGVLVHAGLPVQVGSVAGAAVVDLPAVEQAATVVHRGSMDDVMPTVQALARWIEADGHRSAGYTREFHIAYDEDGELTVELQETVHSGT